MERYLVTGGAGFIGSHIVEALLAEGHFVRILDNFDTGSRKNLPRPSSQWELLEGKLEDPETVRKAVAGMDYVLHQAARGSVPRSLLDPVGTHNSNVTGTLNVLVASKDAGVRRVVSASSSSVYGETPTLPKVETMPATPKSPYAVSKLVTEHYTRIFHEAYALETVALRYFNIFGPRQNPKLQYAAVIPIFIENMIARKPCNIYGDGEQTRDFTFVTDCVRANLLACRTPGISGEVFNIACNRQTSVNQLFELLSELVGNEIPAVYKPARPGDVKLSYADIGKARRKLNFEPKVGLPEGLKQTVEWFSRT
jgi:nucleoside-diphosphate-sugar epimerase